MVILRKILLVFFITLFSLILIVAGATYVFQDKLKAFAIEQINKQIKVPIVVKDGIDISFFRNFPNISINLKTVSIEDPLRKKQQLLKLKEVSLLLNINEVFSQKQTLRKIILNNGSIYLLEDANGKTNFDILKKSDDSTSATELQLQSVLLNNVALTWNSVPSQTRFVATVENAKLKGDFGKQLFALAVNADFDWDYLIIRSDTLQISKSSSLDFALQIDKAKKITQINPSVLKIGDTRFDVNGNINTSFKEFSEINIQASCKGDEIASLFSLLPNSIQQKLQGVKGSGKYAINMEVSGRSGTGTTPKVMIDASLKNGEIDIKKLPEPIKHVNAQLTYDSKKDIFSFPSFSAQYDGKPLDFSLLVLNLKTEPQFDIRANGIVNLKAVQSFIPEQYLQNAEGEIDFKNFHLTGRLDEEKHLVASSLNGSGTFTFKDAEVQANDVTYGNINGLLVYEGDHLQATGLTANFLTADFLFNGEIDNIVPYIVEKVKRENRTALGISGTLSIHQFNLTTMLEAFKKEENKKGEKLDIREIFNMDGKLKLAVDKFQYNKLVFEDIKVDVSLSPGQLNLNSLTTRAMGGNLSNTGAITFSESREMSLTGNLKVEDMELPKIFEESENFGQSTLTAKHLKGVIQADMAYKAVFENYKTINLNKLTALLNCNILKGELINFEPIKAASKFIRVDELNHIYFSDLKNQLIIKNGQIDIPKMEIQSSAINLLLNGSHSFENKIDYHIKVNLRKLLANKFKKNNANEYIEDDPYEGTNIFISMSGNIANPVIKYDKQYAKKKMDADFKQEKENLKTIFKKDAVKTDNKDHTREDKYFDTREKPKFIELDETP